MEEVEEVEEVVAVQESRGPEGSTIESMQAGGELLCAFSIRLIACLVFPCRMRWLQPTGISTVGPTGTPCIKIC